ncbi:unnamed protein product [Pleuronectes platessa]|uniref:REM-1 domain-containing protein n=1 Tax=Pleuronectes platessa TaxID=8262 RepID=A0A9N7V7X1_PLEPL|nr:unnamed protein product [Pleuronectes platessa]
MDSAAGHLPYLQDGDAPIQQLSVPGESLAPEEDTSLSNVPVSMSLEGSGEMGFLCVKDAGRVSAVHKVSVMENPEDPQETVQPPTLPETVESIAKTETHLAKKRISGTGRRAKVQVKPNTTKKTQASKTVAANTNQESGLPGPSTQTEASDAKTTAGKVGVTEPWERSGDHGDIGKETLSVGKSPEDGSPRAQTKTKTRRMITRARKPEDFPSFLSDANTSDPPLGKAASKGPKVQTPRTGKHSTSTPAASTFTVAPSPGHTEQSQKLSHSTSSTTSPALTSPSTSQCTAEVSAPHQGDCVESSATEVLHPFEDMDKELLRHIEREVRMREGASKLLAACSRREQALEASKSLLACNARILALLSQLQKRRKAQILRGVGRRSSEDAVPCTGKVALSDLRVPLMWKDSEYFKNKGELHRCAVFCLLQCGTEIYDTGLVMVDRTLTDICFEDTIVLTQESDPPGGLSGMLLWEEDPCCVRVCSCLWVCFQWRRRTPGYSSPPLSTHLSKLGPKYNLLAHTTLRIEHVQEGFKTHDLSLAAAEDSPYWLPLYGNMCCRLVAQPLCMIQPVILGQLDVKLGEDLDCWENLYGVLRGQSLLCYQSGEEPESEEKPLLVIPIRKGLRETGALFERTEFKHEREETCSKGLSTNSIQRNFLLLMTIRLSVRWREMLFILREYA